MVESNQADANSKPISLSADALHKFANVSLNKILELAKKDDLSDSEGFFIDRVAILSCRIISHEIMKSGLPKKPSTELVAAIKLFKDNANQIFDRGNIYKNNDNLEKQLDKFGENIAATTAVLNKFVEIGPSVREGNYFMREQVENCANASMRMFEEIICQKSKPTIDGFDQVKIQAIMEDFSHILGEK